jgi:hypothetical protein
VNDVLASRSVAANTATISAYHGSVGQWQAGHPLGDPKSNIESLLRLENWQCYADANCSPQNYTITVIVNGNKNSAVNNGTPTPKNPCVADALKAGATNVGIDLLGFFQKLAELPESWAIRPDMLAKLLTISAKICSRQAQKQQVPWPVLSVSVRVIGLHGCRQKSRLQISSLFLSDFTAPVAIAWDAGVAAYAGASGKFSARISRIQGCGSCPPARRIVNTTAVGLMCQACPRVLPGSEVGSLSHSR